MVFGRHPHPAGRKIRFGAAAPSLAARDAVQEYFFGAGAQTLTDAGGIASEETFGVPELLQVQVLDEAGGISSEEAFGVPVLGFDQTLVDAGGIASEEAFGVPTVLVGDDAEAGTKLAMVI